MLLFKGATYFTGRELAVGDVAAEGISIPEKDASIEALAEELSAKAENILITPGFVDVHTHLREPGFSYKETIYSGTLAAAAGGYAAVAAMPNLNPVPDSPESLAVQESIIARDAAIKVYPYAAITVGERGERLADIEALAPRVFAFSDDGRGVADAGIMREAMIRAKAVGKVIAAHCEDEGLVRGGVVHDGARAAAMRLPGISSESEWRQVERDLALAAETGARYHVCHVSTKESVRLIREAKRAGVAVSAETAPHYLTLTEDDLRDEGRFKMNPPLRARTDRDALIEGLCDGTIDVVATDHAPHTDAEKAGGLRGSLMGVVGLETAFPALYTMLALRGEVTLERLLDAMCAAPRRLFRLPTAELEAGREMNVIDLSAEWTVAGRKLLTKGNATPFEGARFRSRNMMTIVNGEIVWKI